MEGSKGIMGSKQKQTKKRSRCDFQIGHWPRLSGSPPTENQYSPFSQLHHMSTGGLHLPQCPVLNPDKMNNIVQLYWEDRRLMA